MKSKPDEKRIQAEKEKIIRRLTSAVCKGATEELIKLSSEHPDESFNWGGILANTMASSSLILASYVVTIMKISPPELAVMEFVKLMSKIFVEMGEESEHFKYLFEKTGMTMEDKDE